MTGTRDPQQDGSIQALLSDSGLESAAEIRSALEQLRALVPDEAPAPRADLAALLAAGAAGQPGPVSARPVSAASGPAGSVPATSVPATSVPATTTAMPAVASAGSSADESNDSASESLPAGVTSLAERRGRKRRLAIVGGALVAAMTLGAGAVAASSEDFRHSVSQTVGVIFQPAGHATPAPAHVEPSPASVPAVPAPAVTARPGTPGAGTPGAPEAPAAGHTRPATPPAVGRDGILPAPGQRPGVPGLPAAPGLRDGGDGEKLPRVPGNITPTLPGVVPTEAPVHP
ncbi:hypothetical protein [Arthrobacter sp. NicSoilB8]|uniref:hypothetical protein n=1 Tax=Arthrobacter sp. NicSoilB8 TaxID=2830998 RepID=UPI001CC6D939|nr:hypothetical protein [Arthrobacter sp. NicSoilB8]BCW69476.1 hypothetical protein NicSoilB8_05200 [Arthrobacter sp. NicSoilB8]